VQQHCFIVCFERFVKRTLAAFFELLFGINQEQTEKTEFTLCLQLRISMI
jgi:hypothetical protein